MHASGLQEAYAVVVIYDGRLAYSLSGAGYIAATPSGHHSNISTRSTIKLCWNAGRSIIDLASRAADFAGVY